jgi:dihydrofolate reductase
MHISWIVACSENGVIGKAGSIPWRLDADMKLFRMATTDRHILMGRRTYESIGRPLPRRVNIVLTSGLDIEGVHCCRTIEEAVRFAEDSGEGELFVIGGQGVYDATRDIVTQVYISRVHVEIDDGDTFFRHEFFMNSPQWKVTERIHFGAVGSQPAFTFEQYEKVPQEA